EGCQSCIKVLARLDRNRLDSQSLLRTDRQFPLSGQARSRIIWVPEKRSAGEAGSQFLEHLKDLPSGEIAELVSDAGDVAAGPRQAGDEARAQGVAGADHDNWDGAGPLAQRLRCLRAGCDY